MLVVPADLGLEQGIGVFIVGDFFVGQEAGEAFLEGVEAAFDFTFGGRVGSHPMGGAQGGESALELGMSIEAVSRRTMAEECQTISVEAGGGGTGFHGRGRVDGMGPSR